MRVLGRGLTECNSPNHILMGGVALASVDGVVDFPQVYVICPSTLQSSVLYSHRHHEELCDLAVSDML